MSAPKGLGGLAGGLGSPRFAWGFLIAKHDSDHAEQVRSVVLSAVRIEVWSG